MKKGSNQVSSMCSVSSKAKAKKPKLTVKKGKCKLVKKQDFIESDDDFVNSVPGPSKCSPEKVPDEPQLSEDDIRRKKAREKMAKSRAKQSAAKKAEIKRTEAQRQKMKRAAETPKEHQKRIKAQAERQSKIRAAESLDEHQKRIRGQNVRQSKKRAAESKDEHQERIRAQAVRQAELRAAESLVEHQERVRVQAERQAEIRANQTPEQQLRERSDARERMAEARKHTTAGFKDATKSREILQGTFHVFPLEKSVDRIGPMNVICNYCGALKFSREQTRTTICCSEGKVALQPFPRPPESLMNLWIGSDSRSRVFKAHSRLLNNAVCLSSLQVTEKRVRGFNPSVTFQGKHHLR